MSVVSNFSTSKAISPAINYAQGKGHRGKLADEFSVGCSTKNASRDFDTVQRAYGYHGKIKLHRMILSFANDKQGKCEVNKDDAKDYVKDFVNRFNKKLGNDFQCYVGFHQNTKSYHAHILFSSVSATGKKYSPKFNEISVARSINDAVARKYNLDVVRPTRIIKNDSVNFSDINVRKFANKHSGNYPYNYKDHARQALSRSLLYAMRKPSDERFSSFKSAMKEQNSSVSRNFKTGTKTFLIHIPNYHRNWTKSSSDSIRTVRNTRLGPAFSKYALRMTLKDGFKDENSKDNILGIYRELAKSRKSVQGGKLDLSRLSNPSEYRKSFNRVKGVPYKDGRWNALEEIKENSERLESGAKRVRGQRQGYRKFIPKGQQARGTGIEDFIPSIGPSTEGLPPEEKESLISEYKFISSLGNDLDYMIDETSDFISKSLNSLSHAPRMQFDYNDNENEDDSNPDSDNDSQSSKAQSQPRPKLFSGINNYNNIIEYLRAKNPKRYALHDKRVKEHERNLKEFNKKIYSAGKENIDHRSSDRHLKPIKKDESQSQDPYRGPKLK